MILEEKSINFISVASVWLYIPRGYGESILTQSVLIEVPAPTALAPPGNLREMQILRPHCKPIVSESLGRGVAQSSVIYQSFWGILM